MRDRRLIIFLSLAIVFAAFFLRYLYRAPKRNYSDFKTFYAAGERFARKEDVYKPLGEDLPPFKYPPLFAMLLGPFSLFPKKVASLIFFTINFIAVIAIFVLSRKLIAPKEITFKESAILYIFPLILSLRFILHALDSGQIIVILFATLLSGLYFLERKKIVLGAAFIALSTMFKYLPVFFLPYFLFRRKIKLVIFILVFMLIYCMLPAAYLGMDKWAHYIQSWLPFAAETSFDRAFLYDYKNQSLIAFTLRHFTKASPYNVSIANLTFTQGFAMALAAGMIIYALILVPGKSLRFNDRIEYSLLLGFMVLFNPNAWMHSFVVFAFIFMALLYYMITVGFKDRVTLVCLILTFALTSLTGEWLVGETGEKLFEIFSYGTLGMLVSMFLFFRLKFEGVIWKENACRS